MKLLIFIAVVVLIIKVDAIQADIHKLETSVDAPIVAHDFYPPKP